LNFGTQSLSLFYIVSEKKTRVEIEPQLKLCLVLNRKF